MENLSTFWILRGFPEPEVTLVTWDFLRTAVNQTFISLKGADSSEVLPGQLGNHSGIVALADFGCVAPARVLRKEVSVPGL